MVIIYKYRLYYDANINVIQPRSIIYKTLEPIFQVGVKVELN